MKSYERYAEKRDLAGLTDYAVAKGSGVSTATMSEWKKTVTGEGKGYEPKVDKLKAIATYLNIPVMDIIGD